MSVKPYYNHNITIFAETNFRNQRKRFGVKRLDRRRHMYIIGKTGMGKTSLIKHLAVQDVRSGEGLCLIDSRDVLVHEVLYYIPKERVRDVIYFNPCDIEYPIGFNILGEVYDEIDREELATMLVGIFAELWSGVWGPRLEYVLKYALLTLLQDENSTILHLLPLLTDRAFRDRLLTTVTDSVLLNFWLNEFENNKESFLEAAIYPIEEEVGQLISNPMIRNIIGQPKISFNFDDIIAKKKIVMMVLNKTAIGEQAAQLFGSCFVARLNLAARKRMQNVEDFYLYVDEFQNFTNGQFYDSVSTSDAGINLILSHQYLNQISFELQKAIFGNVGTIVAFRLSAEDAAVVADEFKHDVVSQDVVTLAPHTVILKLSIDGTTSKPFSAMILEPLPLVGLKDTIIAYSREMYAHRKKDVEKDIFKNLQIQTVRFEERVYEPSFEERLSAFREQLHEVAGSEDVSVSGTPMSETPPPIEESEPQSSAISLDQKAPRQTTTPIRDDSRPTWSSAHEISPGQVVEF